MYLTRERRKVYILLEESIKTNSHKPFYISLTENNILLSKRKNL